MFNSMKDPRFTHDCKTCMDVRVIVRRKRWRAEKGEDYWLVWTDCVSSATEDNNETDNSRYTCGNYFRTKEIAEDAFRRRTELFLSMHEEG